jgi:hypothetical protein
LILQRCVIRMSCWLPMFENKRKNLGEHIDGLSPTARRAKRENGGPGEDPPGSPMTYQTQTKGETHQKRRPETYKGLSEASHVLSWGGSQFSIYKNYYQKGIDHETWRWDSMPGSQPSMESVLQVALED